METHRYVRKNLVQAATEDRYGLNLNKGAQTRSAQNQGSPDNWNTEYWTNGTTTLLSVPSPTPLQNPILVRHSPAATISPLYPKSTQRKMPSGMQRSSWVYQNSSGSPNLIRNSLVAGSLSGIASTIVCHPFDVLRVKMQSSALSTTPIGFSATLRQSLQHGGVRALYTGLTLPLAAQAVYKATVFTVNNISEEAIMEWKTQENYKLGIFSRYQLTAFDRFFCGFMGGAVNAALFVTPVEFVRNQQIAQATTTSSISGPKRFVASVQGPIAIVQATLRSEGPSGLWRGTASTILRDSLGCGCFFAVMAFTKEQLSAHQASESGTPSKSVLISSGALAGVAFGWLGCRLTQ